MRHKSDKNTGQNLDKNLDKNVEKNVEKKLEGLGHGKPVTRRELLSQGLISGTALVLTPSVLGSIYSQTAMGQDAVEACGDASQGSGKDIPAIIIELAGGGNIAGSNVFVGGKGGQSNALSTYKTIGGNGVVPGDKRYGLQWTQGSKILQGIDQFVTVTADRDKIKGILYCSISADDTGNNAFLPSHAIIAAGGMGKLAKIVGSNSGSSGGRSKTAFEQGGLSAVAITKSADARAIVEKHRIAQTLGDEAMNKIIRASVNMGSDSLCKLSRRSITEQLAALCGCRYEKSYQVATGFKVEDLDSNLDQNIIRIFTQANAQGSEASVTKLVLDGYAGVGVLVKGGFDYHDGGRTTGDAKDLEAGQTIGRILAYAIAVKRPVSIMVVTDGGVAGNESGAWTSDSGVRSSALQFAYHPDGVASIEGKDPQIGAYKEDGTVDATVNEISNNTENLALAFTANWLALKGEEQKLATQFPGNKLSSKLDEYLVFKKSIK